MKNRGPAELASEETQPIIELFEARNGRRPQLTWLELSQEESSEISYRLGVSTENGVPTTRGGS